MWKPKTDRTRAALLLLCLGLLMFVPFLGLTDFNSKGEPREALVAQQMLQSGNWILPETQDGEFAYKPPMLHWLVAAASLPMGEVTEWTSRLPSALAAVLTALYTFLFFTRRTRTRGSEGETLQSGFLTAVILLTSFEVFRAAGNCRVDMVLTFFMAAAFFHLYVWVERGMRGFPLWAVAMMGLGTLTKGPVAILLPCMVCGVFALVVTHEQEENKAQRAKRWTLTFLRFFGVGLCALLIPGLWYYAAWHQAGDKFLYLVYEENVLRFLGRMPYHSHEHGLFYYFPVLLAGLLPWALLLLAALFPLPRKEQFVNLRQRLSSRQWMSGKEAPDMLSLFCRIAVALIFFFYLIPKSKRGVYLLPLYPFLSYYMACYVLRLSRQRPKVLTVFQWTISVLLLAGVAGYTLMQYGVFEIKGLPVADIESEYPMLMACCALIAAYFILQRQLPHVSLAVYNVVACYVLLQAFVLPPILNAKSDKPFASVLLAESARTPAYNYANDGTGMIHYFTLQFYTAGRVQNWPEAEESARFNTSQRQMPESGILLIGEKDVEKFEASFPQYRLHAPEDLHHRSCDTRQNLLIYRFQRRK